MKYSLVMKHLKQFDSCFLRALELAQDITQEIGGMSDEQRQTLADKLRERGQGIYVNSTELYGRDFQDFDGAIGSLPIE